MSHQDCRYLALKYTTTFNIWPLQEPAFKDVDRLIEKQKQTQEQQRETTAAADKKTQQQQQQYEEQIKQLEDVLWSKEPRLFSFECNEQGKRKYIATHLGRFINFYWRECDARNRHYYELIRENSPCRLYFDIEYNKKANPLIDDVINETLLEDFFDELKAEIYDKFKLSIDRASIVDLDSSTENKFSRHVIVHMPNKELFRNNIECGIFVKNFISRLAEEVATGVMKERGKDALQNHLFVYAKELSDPNMDASDNPMSQFQTCIVDTGVYTRNRIFRILGSTKYGKPSTAALRISSTNQFPFPNKNQNDLFMQDAKSRRSNDDIPPVDGEEGLRTYGEEERVCSIGTYYSAKSCTYKTVINDLFSHTLLCFEKETALSIFAKVFADTLVVPCVEDRQGAPILSSIDPTYPASTITLSSKTTTATCHIDQKSSLVRSDKYHNVIGPSPFPELDKFVNSVLATRKNIHGSIRSWSIQNEEQLSSSIITYQIKDNRWCENIQRSHKSNNIMWHVSIADFKYWQSCFDPDCRQMSFRGKETHLPSKIKDHITKILIDQEVQASDSFEKALLDLSIGEGNKYKNDSFYELDESFEQALLRLNISQNSPNKQDQNCCGSTASEDVVEDKKETCLKHSQSTKNAGSVEVKDGAFLKALGRLNLEE